MCVRERERERESVCVCVRERECVCVCVCARVAVRKQALVLERVKSHATEDKFSNEHK